MEKGMEIIASEFCGDKLNYFEQITPQLIFSPSPQNLSFSPQPRLHHLQPHLRIPAPLEKKLQHNNTKAAK